jgi:hypothetical protein
LHWDYPVSRIIHSQLTPTIINSIYTIPIAVGAGEYEPRLEKNEEEPHLRWPTSE